MRSTSVPRLFSAVAVLALTSMLISCHNAQKLPEGYAQGDYYDNVHVRGTAPGTPPRGVNMAGVRDSEDEYAETDAEPMNR